MLSTSSEILEIQTSKGPGFMDITGKIQSFIRNQDITDGVLVIFSKHTTASIKINENETQLKKDMAEFINQLAPENQYYRHNDFSKRTENMTDDESPNGHCHCQSLGMGTSETIPIINGQLQIGRWQSVFLIELDQAQKREVLLQVIEES